MKQIWPEKRDSSGRFAGEGKGRPGIALMSKKRQRETRRRWNRACKKYREKNRAELALRAKGKKAGSFVPISQLSPEEAEKRRRLQLIYQRRYYAKLKKDKDRRAVYLERCRKWSREHDLRVRSQLAKKILKKGENVRNKDGVMAFMARLGIL